MVCPQSPGKLVRQLVQDGEHVVEGQAFAEIEVMKMIQTMASPAAGVISFQVSGKDKVQPNCALNVCAIDGSCFRHHGLTRS